MCADYPGDRLLDRGSRLLTNLAVERANRATHSYDVRDHGVRGTAVELGNRDDDAREWAGAARDDLLQIRDDLRADRDRIHAQVGERAMAAPTSDRDRKGVGGCCADARRHGQPAERQRAH
jgi:hypothetical protein